MPFFAVTMVDGGEPDAATIGRVEDLPAVGDVCLAPVALLHPDPPARNAPDRSGAEKPPGQRPLVQGAATEPKALPAVAHPRTRQNPITVIIQNIWNISPQAESRISRYVFVRSPVGKLAQDKVPPEGGAGAPAA